jgi:hypothetical protein
MPTFIPGTDGEFKMDNASAALTDYNDEVAKFSSDIDFTNGEFATFGLGFQATPGRRKYKASIAFYPATASSFYNMLMAWLHPGAGTSHAAKTVRFDMPNSNAGSHRIEGEFIPDSFNTMAQDAESDGKPSLMTMPGKFMIEPTYSLLS